MRDYGVPGQLGLERTPEEYIEKMVAVFQEVRRVMRLDATLWLNLGDSYNGSGGAGGDYGPGGLKEGQPKFPGRKIINLKPKDLCGIPWRLALALQADGWWLRSEITWCKKSPMPESVTDRPTSATEKIFLLTKSTRYYYDNTQREISGNGWHGSSFNSAQDIATKQGLGMGPRNEKHGRNFWNYWVLGPANFSEAHFATFPPAIPERCIKLGSKEGDLILDPFSGAATTLMVAGKLGRDAIGIELNPDYVAMSVKRLKQELGMLVELNLEAIDCKA